VAGELVATDSCGSPVQEATSLDLETKGQTVLAGEVHGEAGPVKGAFVRLLDARGDFTGEVVTSPAGEFRFYAAPGAWTVRALHRTGHGETTINASGPGVHRVSLQLG
jgi:hypothetical protein